MINLATLAEELKKPEFAALVERQDVHTIAAMLNVVDSATSRIRLGTVTRDDFIGTLSSIISVLLDKSSTDPKAAFWLRFYELCVVPKDTFNTASPAFLGFLSRVKADGLIDDGWIEELTTRVGSRAEELFGPGAEVNGGNVLDALGLR